MPEMLLNDLNFFVFLFEALVVRDLRIYAEIIGGKVFHYRNLDINKEIDAVVEIADGRWIAIEIKLGANQVDEAAKNLVKLRDTFAKDEKYNKLVALVIICGVIDIAYKRDDGIIVVPITALKP